MLTLCLGRMRKESRSALLASKRAIDAGQVSNREELLRSTAVREKQDLNEKVTYVLPSTCSDDRRDLSILFLERMHSWRLATK